MRIDLTCPVEVWKTELPREDYRAVTITLYNLSGRFVNSVEVTVILQDGEGKEKDRLIHRAHDLDGRPAAAFAMTVPCHVLPADTRIEILPDKVWFDDNAVWRRGRDSMVEYTPNDLPQSRGLEMLRYAAGKNAVGFPQQQDGLWLCVCGRPNGDDEDVCARCRLTKKQVFSQFSREIVEKKMAQRFKQADLKAKAVREDSSRMQLQREQEYNIKRKKRRRVIAWTSAAVAAAVLAYGGIFHLAPYLTYKNAADALEKGEYADAYRALSGMGEYKNAPALAQEANYRYAESLLDSGDAAKLIEARDIFLSMPGYESADELLLQADYARAVLLSDTDRAAAEELFTALSVEEYRDAGDRLNACRFLDAEDLFAAGDYAGAKAIFLALGDEASLARAKACDLKTARGLLDAGDADGAIELADALDDYEGAADLLHEAWYVKAGQLRDGGDPVAAGEAYFKAEDWKDALQKARECLYAPADEAYAAGDTLKAAELFSSIRDYLDSEEKYRDSAYRTAEAAVNDREYELALRWLTTLPADYKDNAELQQRCVYEPAVQALERGEYAAAMQGFESVITYEDSAALLLKAKYGFAGQLADAGEYESAVALYSQLGTYEDTQKLMRSARYDLGVQYMNNERWGDAADQFSQLGSYKDSADRLKKCRYTQAQIDYENGDYAGAREAFAELKRYQDAADRVKACDYAIAGQLAEAGSIEEAAELYAFLGDYENAAERTGEMYHLLGENAEKAGQTLKAAVYYEKAGTWGDSAEKAAALYDAYYAAAAAAVHEAMERGDNDLALLLMNNMDMDRVPEQYASLKKDYIQASLNAADSLYAEGKVWEALPYYRAAAEDKRAADALTRSCYQILGTWQTDDGFTVTFTDDGMLVTPDETLTFAVEDRSVMTGEKVGEMTATHRLLRLDSDYLTLRDTREGGRGILKLTRVKDAEPADAPASQEQTPPADFTVVDEEGEGGK